MENNELAAFFVGLIFGGLGVMLLIATTTKSPYAEIENLKNEIIKRGYAEMIDGVGGEKMLIWKEEK